MAKKKPVDLTVTKALARRYGTKTGREGARYSTSEEIAERPDAWEGDASDLEEPEEQAEETVKE